MKSRNVVSRVEREIDLLLSQPDAVPTLEVIASRLHLHVRTLQRQLGHRRVAFRQLLDGCRRRRAINKVAAGDEALAAIARELGYSDQAHFARAFRRWTGLSPTAYRNSPR